MSALGQKQTYAVHQPMSALPPIATSIAFFSMCALGQKHTFLYVWLVSKKVTARNGWTPLGGRGNLRTTAR